MEKYLEDAVYIIVTKESYDSLQKYKEQDLSRANLGDEPLQPEPFFHGLPDVIANYRRHLITAHGGKIYNKKWRLHYNVKTPKSVIHNWIDFTEEELKTESDNAFFEKLEGFIIKD